VEKVKVYGADWCGDTQRTLRQLDSLGVGYDYVDIEQDEAARSWVRQQNDGKERKPTLQVGERVLSTPKAAELEEALRESGVLKG